ncbi:hypothetical protein DA2_3164 [Desulfovibrio sp. A2]|nr:hypothetical protein DA2_3164 [Desulfovibrio sp. A2]
MKITRILPAALALVAITAGAALAAQNGPATAMGSRSCPGSATMQSRHANMPGMVGMNGGMGQRMQNGQHMMRNGGQHMMSGPMASPMTNSMNSAMPGAAASATGTTGTAGATGLSSTPMLGLSAGK